MLTTKRRIHEASLSQGFYKAGNKLLQSTIRVCEKAVKLVQNTEEKKALVQRLKYEARHAYLTGHYNETEGFIVLLRELKALNISYKVLAFMSACKFDLRFVRKAYYRLRYNN